MTDFEWLGIAILAIWWLVTVAFQFEPPGLRTINFHGFVPSCRFFAPRPVVTDARVYYGHFAEPDGPLGEAIWQPIIVTPESPARPLWNPHQRLHKSIQTIVRQLGRLEAKGARMPLTIPYLRLLNVAQEHSRAACSEGYVRFIVTRHRGVEEPGRYIVFVSEAHRIGDV
ncbi:hypothetical protein [Novosphingobium sp. M1R2S20]|uniref:Uncharacterized protein n=1 Tax=Novosphingobium rhizovicinum TaxID=3228928 RepID=A0ABV3R7D2_9SPHN